jgi:hypothetical protein
MVISGFAGMLGDAGVGPQHIMMLGSGRSNILKNQEKEPKSTSISILIDQFSCKNWLIKDGGCL